MDDANIEDADTGIIAPPAWNKARFAPEGTQWVCTACGRVGRDRYNMGDTSCSLRACLVWLKRNEAGFFIAVPDDAYAAMEKPDA